MSVNLQRVLAAVLVWLSGWWVLTLVLYCLMSTEKHPVAPFARAGSASGWLVLFVLGCQCFYQAVDAFDRSHRGC